MKYALVNPPWTFEGSIYFGCREWHLPLEFGYSKALLEREGHAAAIFDAQGNGWDYGDLVAEVEKLQPDFIAVCTAPSYLFWRCAPPELRVPMETFKALRHVGAKMVAVGPHGSTTPRAALRKLSADVVIIGECEEILPQLASRPWPEVPSICYLQNDDPVIQGGPHASNMDALPTLEWPAEMLSKHTHHHHRFDRMPHRPGAEVEFSRGCPYHCTFCAKDNFRDKYRRRTLGVVLEEIDGLIARGAEYVYFVDEIFLPNRELLEALVPRVIEFGVQTRLDLWPDDMIELLGRAGCVSIEAGVESISEAGRNLLAKQCRLTTTELTRKLILARKHVPFVQGNLIAMEQDSEEEVEQWRQHLEANGVWANKPVPLYPYPGSPDYTLRFGVADDYAWERAHEYYLSVFDRFSDIQDQRPSPLTELEQVDAR